MKQILKIAALIAVIILAQPLQANAQEVQEPPMIIDGDEIDISGVVIDVGIGSFTIGSAGNEVVVSTEEMGIANLNTLIMEGMEVEVSGNLNAIGPAVSAEEIRVVGVVGEENQTGDLLPDAEDFLNMPAPVPLTNPGGEPIFMPPN